MRENLGELDKVFRKMNELSPVFDTIRENVLPSNFTLAGSDCMNEASEGFYAYRVMVIEEWMCQGHPALPHDMLLPLLNSHGDMESLSFWQAWLFFTRLKECGYKAGVDERFSRVNIPDLRGRPVLPYGPLLREDPLTSKGLRTLFALPIRSDIDGWGVLGIGDSWKRWPIGTAVVGLALS